MGCVISLDLREELLSSYLNGPIYISGCIKSVKLTELFHFSKELTRTSELAFSCFLFIRLYLLDALNICIVFR